MRDKHSMLIKATFSTKCYVICRAYVRLFVCLSVCLSVCYVGGLWSYGATTWKWAHVSVLLLDISVPKSNRIVVCCDLNSTDKAWKNVEVCTSAASNILHVALSQHPLNFLFTYSVRRKMESLSVLRIIHIDRGLWHRRHGDTDAVAAAATHRHEISLLTLSHLFTLPGHVSFPWRRWYTVTHDGNYWGLVFMNIIRFHLTLEFY